MGNFGSKGNLRILGPLKRPLTQDEMSDAAKGRSSNYEDLTPQEQWEEDKELDILDWDGN